MNNQGNCSYWHSFVDPKTKSHDMWSNLDDEKAMEAIQCFLALKGNSKPSRFEYANVAFHLSRRLPGPSIETAALYYVSYVFYNDWHHADAIRIMDKQGNPDTKESVQAAFKSYESWIKKVKEIGLEEARKQKLDPLAGSGVNWY
jgi:hypothetical protein